MNDQKPIIDPFAIADELLPEIQFTGGYAVSDGRIPIEITSDKHKIAIEQLVLDGYMIRTPLQKAEVYKFTASGLDFISRGGYKGRFEEERQLRELNKQQIESVISTNQSVQETNQFTIANSRRQNRLTIASIIVAATLAIFALGAIIAQQTDTTDEEVRLLRLQLQKQAQVQEQMQQSQKGIDSSMKIFLQHSDTFHH